MTKSLREETFTLHRVFGLTSQELIERVFWRRIADDQMVKMGRRVSMSDARLNGTQVWYDLHRKFRIQMIILSGLHLTARCSKICDRARELHDGSILLGLLNAQSAVALEDNCTWETRTVCIALSRPGTDY